MSISRQRDPKTGQYLPADPVHGYHETLEKAQPVLAAMVDLYDAETDELGKNKIMQALCQLAFWLWGWSVQTFHENFKAVAEKELIR